MSDALNRGGAMSAMYRSIKTKGSGVIRLDKNKVLTEVAKMSKLKGDGHNSPMAKSMGPEKGIGKVKY